MAQDWAESTWEITNYGRLIPIHAKYHKIDIAI